MVTSLRELAARVCRESAVYVARAGAFVVNCGSNEEALSEFDKLKDAFSQRRDLEFIGEIEDGVMFRILPVGFTTSLVKLIVAPSDKKLVYVEVIEKRG